MSDDWVSEEVAAHHVERVVYDEWTEGQYSRTVVENATSITADSVQAYLEKLNPDYFRRLDALFPQASTEEAQSRFGNFFLHQLEDWLALHGYDTEADRIKAYRVYRSYNNWI